MRLIIIIFFLLVNVCRAQTKGFVVTKNHDTVHLTIDKIRNSVQVIGEINKKEVIYKSKDLISVHFDSTVYESIKIGRIWKRWMLARRTIGGHLSLLLYSQLMQKTSSPRDDIIYGPGYRNTYRTYVRKKSESFGTVHQLGLRWKSTLRKICADCQPVLTKLSEKGNIAPEEIIKLYNDKCP